jgi:hypothetical protein
MIFKQPIKIYCSLFFSDKAQPAGALLEMVSSGLMIGEIQPKCCAISLSILILLELCIPYASNVKFGYLNCGSRSFNVYDRSG